MNTTRSTAHKVRNALGMLSIATAMLLASITSTGTLRATQDEPPVANAAKLVPEDIREEALEKVDAAFAASAGPQLRVLFNNEESADARRSAAAELTNLADQADQSTPGMASAVSRLRRRIALIEATVNAGEVQDLSAGSTTSNVPSAAQAAIDWLNSVGNGQLWLDYLHLNDLLDEGVSADVLKKVSENLTPAETMEDSQRSFMQRPQLLKLKAAIDSTLATGSADSGEEAARAELKQMLDHLVASTLAYEARQLSVDADAVRSAYRALRSRFPAAYAVISPVMVNHYFNHNLHITVSENLLSRLVSDYRSESGCIADCIMGAWVTGSQVTSVNVTADIIPSSNSAAFRIQADGNTRSDTIARKDPATVRTLGNHFFHTAKPVYFNGHDVYGGPGSIDVNVNSQTVAVNTKYDGIPLIGGIIRNIARKEVAKSKGQSEALTRDRLRDEALPKFETEVDNQLAELNDTLHKTLSSLERKGVAPESISARSSSNQIAVSSRTMNVNRVGGSTQPPMLLSSSGLALQVHETALNNTIDALEFNGRSIPEDQVASELEAALSELLQRDIKLSKDDKPKEESTEEPEPPTTFVFSSTDPIRAHFGEDEIILVLRAGVNQEGKDPIPEQIITVPISVSLQGGKLILEPGTFGVASVEETNRARQIGRANQIRRVLGRTIVRRELDTTFDLQGSADRALMLTLSYIRISDGWVTAELQ
ncbi:MAG: hypothetical protein R3C20_05870 [Planctomycetaceae bacterium]